MRVVMAADPAGQDYLLALCEALQELRADSEQFEVVPLTGDDWPENVRQVGFLVATRAADRGILTGPTGNGEALMINRIPEARCTVCWDVRSALAARRELNANVLAIARNHIPLPRARRIADLWLRLAFRPRTHHDPALRSATPTVAAGTCLHSLPSRFSCASGAGPNSPSISTCSKAPRRTYSKNARCAARRTAFWWK
jgi:RpiB/LacA/LacB family sugar-phosphate isomerase